MCGNKLISIKYFGNLHLISKVRTSHNLTMVNCERLRVPNITIILFEIFENQGRTIFRFCRNKGLILTFIIYGYRRNQKSNSSVLKRIGSWEFQCVSFVSLCDWDVCFVAMSRNRNTIAQKLKPITNMNYEEELHLKLLRSQLLTNYEILRISTNL